MGKYFKMFNALSNLELKRLIQDLYTKKLPKNLFSEVYAQERGRGSKSTALLKLNRVDLLLIAYALLRDEIEIIDAATERDYPELINRTWSCHQLTERLQYRIACCKGE